MLQTGDIKQVTFNKLRGPVYLFPGRRAADGTITNTFVSKGTDSTDASLRILSANSRQDATEPTVAERYSLSNASLLPPDNILRKATTNNDSLTYINRINLSGFKSGLKNCQDTGSCPGFGSAGAYPVMTYVKSVNRLTLTNNQTFLNLSDDEKLYSTTYVKEYGDVNGEASCKDGDIPVQREGNSEYTGENGWQVNSPIWCKTSGGAQRGDGAIIIVW